MKTAIKSELITAPAQSREKSKNAPEWITRYCEKHGEYEAKRLVVFGQEIITNCQLCAAEESAAEEREKKAKLEAEKAANFKRMNIEPEFYGATLENYRAETGSQTAAFEAVSKMVLERRGAVALSGSFGVGKTHLACAAAKELGGAVYTMFEIALRIRCTYAPKATETELDVLKELSALPFLAIDEIGRSKGAEAEANWLSYIIDKRHVRFLPTMLLSNKKLARQLPQEKWRDSFEAAIGDDVAQRIKAAGVTIALDGRNWRER